MLDNILFGDATRRSKHMCGHQSSIICEIQVFLSGGSAEGAGYAGVGCAGHVSKASRQGKTQMQAMYSEMNCAT
jgi:hypothetical protein